jgi:hypothetical protein
MQSMSRINDASRFWQEAAVKGSPAAVTVQDIGLEVSHRAFNSADAARIDAAEFTGEKLASKCREAGLFRRSIQARVELRQYPALELSAQPIQQLPNMCRATPGRTVSDKLQDSQHCFVSAHRSVASRETSAVSTCSATHFNCIINCIIPAYITTTDFFAAEFSADVS